MLFRMPPHSRQLLSRIILMFLVLFMQGPFRSALCQGEGTSESPDATARPVTINFDTLPTNVVLPANQYQSASFSSNGTIYTQNDCGLGGSCPNGIFPIAPNPSYNAYNGDLYINFATPVTGLTFHILDSQANGFSATVDILVNNQLAFSGPFYGPKGGPGYISPPLLMDFSTIQHVTGIRIRNVTNFDYNLYYDYALYYDDFTFTPELVDNIINSRVNGGLDQTTQNALLGADISLQASISQSGGTYSWTFTPSSLVSITSGSQTSSSITIRSTDTGTVNAKLTYTLNGA